MNEVEDFYNKIKDIKYGWHDKDNVLHTRLVIDKFRKEYKMQKIANILKSGYAICWEMCELQRNFMERKGIEHKTIFVYLNNSNNECHTFTSFKLDNDWYWFEASWKGKKGIHKFSSLKDILEFYRNNFNDFAKNGYDKNNISFYEYDRIAEGCSCDRFYEHCLSGKLIKL